MILKLEQDYVPHLPIILALFFSFWIPLLAVKSLQIDNVWAILPCYLHAHQKILEYSHFTTSQN